MQVEIARLKMIGILNTEQAADYLEVTQQSMYNLVARHRLPKKSVGGYNWFLVEDLELYKKARVRRYAAHDADADRLLRQTVRRYERERILEDIDHTLCGNVMRAFGINSAEE